MNTTNGKSKGYSAKVRLELRLNGDTLLISHLAGDYLILRNPIAHPPAVAEIDMWIDDDHERWPVYLVDGISAIRGRIRIAKVPAEIQTERTAEPVTASNPV